MRNFKKFIVTQVENGFTVKEYAEDNDGPVQIYIAQTPKTLMTCINKIILTAEERDRTAKVKKNHQDKKQKDNAENNEMWECLPCTTKNFSSADRCRKCGELKEGSVKPE